MYSRWTSPHVRRLFVPISQRFPRLVHLRQVHPLKEPYIIMYKPLDIIACPAAFLFLFLNAFFRGCSCLNCTNQARATPTKQELHQYCSVGALETSAPP